MILSTVKAHHVQIKVQPSLSTSYNYWLCTDIYCTRSGKNKKPVRNWWIIQVLNVQYSLQPLAWNSNCSIL